MGIQFIYLTRFSLDFKTSQYEIKDLRNFTVLPVNFSFPLWWFFSLYCLLEALGKNFPESKLKKPQTKQTMGWTSTV